ncbi:MAG: putative peptidoglycan glycosyltransferase FtsW [Solirubrobacterales bacterium]
MRPEGSRSGRRSSGPGKRRLPESGAGRKARSKRKKVRAEPTVDYSLLLTATFILLAFGAVMVYSASSTSVILKDGGLADSASFLQRTLIAIGIGLLLMWLAIRIPLARVREMVPWMIKIILVALAGVLLFGTAVNGTKGWYDTGPVQIQPAEFLKIGLVLYGAHLFANRPDRLHSVREMAPFLGLTTIASVLVMLQPDMGTILVAVAAAGITLFAAGARLRDLALLVSGLGVAALLLALIAPYRRQRLLTFLDPSSDITGSGFQTFQAKIAIGSGGLDGVGIGNGVQKAFYLPEAHTDMISAVIGEEFGLVGMVLLIAVYGLIGYAGFRIARAAKDDFGRILASGLTGLILFQAGLNLYAVMGWAPLTGVPLPLVSYGNNSLIVTLIAIGLILNVARGGRAATLIKAPPRRGRHQGARLRLVKDGSRDQPTRRTATGAYGSHGGGRYGGARGPGRGNRRRASR